MAYPFGFSITFLNFRTLLEARFQCGYEILANSIAIDEQDGSMFKAKYLERAIDGRIIQCSVEGLEDDQLLMPSQVRRICRRLEIDPRQLNIGLPLG